MPLVGPLRTADSSVLSFLSSSPASVQRPFGLKLWDLLGLIGLDILTEPDVQENERLARKTRKVKIFFFYFLENRRFLLSMFFDGVQYFRDILTCLETTAR